MSVRRPLLHFRAPLDHAGADPMRTRNSTGADPTYPAPKTVRTSLPFAALPYEVLLPKAPHFLLTSAARAFTRASTSDAGNGCRASNRIVPFAISQPWSSEACDSIASGLIG